jgi:puromycin-sensitive aminopeptidase
MVQYKYGSSPIMSTYLLAFVIAHFDYIMAKTKSGVEVRVYLPLGKSQFGKFSLDVAVRSLEFFDE